MDLRYSPAEQEFRGELREWLAGVLPTLGAKPSVDDWPGRRAYDTGWQRMLYDAGYAGINWPKEYGGLGATPTEHLIFLEESERAGAPYVGVNFVGLLHAGPTLIAEASPELQHAHLPGILRSDLVWCPGFSEPGAGSELASLRCKAVRDGDDYVVTGQKIWTSHSAVADFCELLVRTDPGAPKHQGISWLVMPMDAAGITVRPLRTIIGSAEFAEMFLDEVRIPLGNRVGAENDGWRVTNVTLSFERRTAFVGDVVDALETGIAAATVDLAVQHAKEREQFGRTIGSFQAVKHLCADMHVRAQIASVAAHAAAVTLDHPSIGDAGRAVASAKLLADEAANLNAKTSIQVHGGMGSTWDVVVHYYLKRGWVSASRVDPVRRRRHPRRRAGRPALRPICRGCVRSRQTRSTEPSGGPSLAPLRFSWSGKTPMGG